MGGDGAGPILRYGAGMSGPVPRHYNPVLIEAAMALNENRLDVAERILKPHLKEDPFDAAAVRMLAELAARIGRMRDAENLLRRAVELAPEWVAPKANLALVLGRTRSEERRVGKACSSRAPPSHPP